MRTLGRNSLSLSNFYKLDMHIFKFMIEELTWGSPIGLGIFLVCFSLFVYFLSKSNARKWDKK